MGAVGQYTPRGRRGSVDFLGINHAVTRGLQVVLVEAVPVSSVAVD